MQPGNSEKLLYFYTENKGFNEMFHLLAHVMRRMDSQIVPILPHFARYKLRLKEHNSKMNDHTQKS